MAPWAYEHPWWMWTLFVLFACLIVIAGVLVMSLVFGSPGEPLELHGVGL